MRAAFFFAVCSTRSAVSRMKPLARPASSLVFSLTLSPKSADAIKFEVESANAEVCEKKAPCQALIITNKQSKPVAKKRPKIESCFVKKFSFIEYNLREI